MNITVSPSSRRAWIEIIKGGTAALRQHVALLAEGVDRNLYRHGQNRAIRVALLAEGVDRNLCYPLNDQIAVWSPSSRRAWIEIACS